MKKNEVIISDKGAEFVEKGQMWMYSNNLVNDIEGYENGSIVDVISESGKYLGSGMLSKLSHITVRLLTKDRDEEINRDFFKKRIKFAYDYRKTLMYDNLDNCRLIFGEADGMPGLTCDRYNDILVTQITSFGFEVIKDMLYELLLEVLHEDNQDVKAIYERNDVKARSKEGLELYKGFYGDVKLNTVTVINENGLKLNVDIENGQKTGYFLDQKSNRVLLRHMAKDKRVLDCFSHTGGFALNAAYGKAKHVVAVDVSKTALDEAQKNANLNNLDNVEFVQADVFDYLDTLKDNEFDIIVLDPPAFTKSKRTVMKAYNGYKRINKQAMNVLRNGGYLITCSCSRYMEEELFMQMLKEASSEVGVKLKQISVTQQSCDHPILWSMDETSYLKFFIFQII